MTSTAGNSSRNRACVSALALVVTLLVPLSFSLAQQAPPTPGPRPPLPQAKGPGPAARDLPPAAEGGLQRRVEQLEEQLVDLQVFIGTLESLAKGATAPLPGPRAGAGPAAAFNASDPGRLDAIETQIRALASQLENMQDQMRNLGSSKGQADDDRPPRKQPPGFGSTTVAPSAQRDEIDRLLSPPPGGGGPRTAAAQPPSGGQSEPDVPPQQLYEQAYGYLLQKDYGAAETGFDDFLKRHPSHQLAGNAQYWLGESHYVRGQYRAAAAAFLKGYQTYAKSQKAPESLLKLAMSLQRLGQKDAACSSFNELATKYPNPPAHVKSIAQAERQRSGCGA
jgi:tol-pal system protein YbgF